MEPKKIKLDRSKCKHLKTREQDTYSYIPSECVMQIEDSFTYCLSCNKILN